MKKQFVLSTLLTLAVLSSCSRNIGGGQRATVLMRDGTRVSGTIVSNSGGENQIAGDEKVTRTIPIAQVRSIEYDETPPATVAGNPSQPLATPPATSTPPRARREATHREHYHPVESAITTKSHELPAGTEISVRSYSPLRCQAGGTRLARRKTVGATLCQPPISRVSRFSLTL